MLGSPATKSRLVRRQVTLTNNQKPFPSPHTPNLLLDPPQSLSYDAKNVFRWHLQAM